MHASSRNRPFLLCISVLFLTLFRIYTNRICATLPQSPIPRKIWQISLSLGSSSETPYRQPRTANQQRISASWRTANPGYEYRSISDDDGWADRFVDEHFASEPRITRTYHALRRSDLKAHLLQYLVLLREGGVSIDFETTTAALKPIDEWLPRGSNPEADARILVTTEEVLADSISGGDARFSQSVIATAPDHPIISAMVRRIITSLDRLAYAHNIGLGALKLSPSETAAATGSVAWGHVILEYLQQVDLELVDLGNVTSIMEPVLYGDVYVVPLAGLKGSSQNRENEKTVDFEMRRGFIA